MKFMKRAFGACLSPEVIYYGPSVVVPQCYILLCPCVPDHCLTIYFHKFHME